MRNKCVRWAIGLKYSLGTRNHFRRQPTDEISVQKIFRETLQQVSLSAILEVRTSHAPSKARRHDAEARGCGE